MMVDKPNPNEVPAVPATPAASATPVTPGGSAAAAAQPGAAPKRSPGHRSADMRDTVAELSERAQIISQEAGSKVAAAMKDVISAGAGIAGFAIESARDLVSFMVRRGQMTAEEADKLIREAEAAHEKRSPSEKSRPTATKIAAEKAVVAKAEAGPRAAAAAAAMPPYRGSVRPVVPPAAVPVPAAQKPTTVATKPTPKSAKTEMVEKAPATAVGNTPSKSAKPAKPAKQPAAVKTGTKTTPKATAKAVAKPAAKAATKPTAKPAAKPAAKTAARPPGKLAKKRKR